MNEDKKIQLGVTHTADTAEVDAVQALGGMGTTADNGVHRMRLASVHSSGPEDVDNPPYTPERVVCSAAAPTSR